MAATYTLMDVAAFWDRLPTTLNLAPLRAKIGSQEFSFSRISFGCPDGPIFESTLPIGSPSCGLQRWYGGENKEERNTVQAIEQVRNFAQENGAAIQVCVYVDSGIPLPTDAVISTFEHTGDMVLYGKYPGWCESATAHHKLIFGSSASPSPSALDTEFLKIFGSSALDTEFLNSEWNAMAPNGIAGGITYFMTFI